MKKIAISLLVLALVAAFSATGVVSAATCAATTSATTTSAQCTSCTTAASCCCPCPVVTCCPVVTTCVVTKCSQVNTVTVANTVAVAKAGGVSAAGGIGTQATSTTQSIGAITQNNVQAIYGDNNTNITFAPQSNSADPTNLNVPVNLVADKITISPTILADLSQFNDNVLNNSRVG